MDFEYFFHFNVRIHTYEITNKYMTMPCKPFSLTKTKNVTQTTHISQTIRSKASSDDKRLSRDNNWTIRKHTEHTTSARQRASNNRGIVRKPGAENNRLAIYNASIQVYPSLGRVHSRRCRISGVHSRTVHCTNSGIRISTTIPRFSLSTHARSIVRWIDGSIECIRMECDSKCCRDDLSKFRIGCVLWWNFERGSIEFLFFCIIRVQTFESVW